MSSYNYYYNWRLRELEAEKSKVARELKKAEQQLEVEKQTPGGRIEAYIRIVENQKQRQQALKEIYKERKKEVDDQNKRASSRQYWSRY